MTPPTRACNSHTVAVFRTRSGGLRVSQTAALRVRVHRKPAVRLGWSGWPRWESMGTGTGTPVDLPGDLVNSRRDMTHWSGWHCRATRLSPSLNPTRQQCQHCQAGRGQSRRWPESGLLVRVRAAAAHWHSKTGRARQPERDPDSESGWLRAARGAPRRRCCKNLVTWQWHRDGHGPRSAGRVTVTGCQASPGPALQPGPGLIELLDSIAMSVLALIACLTPSRSTRRPQLRITAEQMIHDNIQTPKLG